MSLKEIAAINEERRNGELTCERSLEITRAQLVRLEAKGDGAGHDDQLCAR
jgi:hypothetical protein